MTVSTGVSNGGAMAFYNYGIGLSRGGDLAEI